jgi:phosphoglycerate dehydrogenase-like enzyme
MRARVAILDDYQEVALKLGPWGDLGEDVFVTRFREHMTDDELVERLAPFDVVVAMRERTPFPRDRLERLPALRLLVMTGRANAAIDMEAARELGIVVAGTGGLTSAAVELTWALILAVCRNICAEDRRLREGGWQHTIGIELEGRTLGVVGLGRPGSKVAAIGQAFGMEVIAWSQNLQAEHAAVQGVTAVAKEDLFRRADVVTVHLKLSERSRGVVGTSELAAMKPSAYLVNTSRGPIVDERALLQALHDGSMAGAALDVYDVEPLWPTTRCARRPGPCSRRTSATCRSATIRLSSAVPWNASWATCAVSRCECSPAETPGRPPRTVAKSSGAVAAAFGARELVDAFRGREHSNLLLVT